jgi:hypothetical protein
MLKFNVGDRVRRLNGLPFDCSNSHVGKVVGFAERGKAKESWVEIEGEIYTTEHGHVKTNYFNPYFLVKIELATKFIKKYNFIKN